MPDSLDVLFLAAEAEPFVKVGGLGDVAGSLPRFLRNLETKTTGRPKLDVRLVLPMHSVLKIDRLRLHPLLMFPLAHEGGEINVQVLTTVHEGMPVYFLGAAPVSQGGSVYSSDPALDASKYTFFPLAALELAHRLEWKPQIVHANDWHTSLACYALLLRRRVGEYADTASVLTLHNLPYMGPDISHELRDYGLPLIQTGLPDWAGRKPLPLGLWAADAIVAVSPSYAREIQTPEFGCGLEDYLRARRESLHGILNGIDNESYNPALDPAIASNFGVPTLDRRVANKGALQEQLGLPVAPEIPLVAVISRMDPQKGIDLVPRALRQLRELSWQFVVLGTGSPKLEGAMQALQRALPDRVRAELRFDDGLARQIYAGADVLLMPSRYEPCGLAQLIAMRYGCVPIVTAVGGLKDTVVEDETGFILEKPTASRLATAIKRALKLWDDKPQWAAMQRLGMSKDFSWAVSAAQYRDLYQTALSHVAPS